MALIFQRGPSRGAVPGCSSIPRKIDFRRVEEDLILAGVWDFTTVHSVSADKAKRVRIPDAKPGQVFDDTVNMDGSFVLTPVKKAEPVTRICKLVRRNGHLMMETPEGYTMVSQKIKADMLLTRDTSDFHLLGCKTRLEWPQQRP